MYSEGSRPATLGATDLLIFSSSMASLIAGDGAQDPARMQYLSLYTSERKSIGVQQEGGLSSQSSHCGMRSLKRHLKTNKEGDLDCMYLKV